MGLGRSHIWPDVEVEKKFSLKHVVLFYEKGINLKIKMKCYLSISIFKNLRNNTSDCLLTGIFV